MANSLIKQGVGHFVFSPTPRHLLTFYDIECYLLLYSVEQKWNKFGAKYERGYPWPELFPGKVSDESPWFGHSCLHTPSSGKALLFSPTIINKSSIY
jgi:hypothetical protein